MIYEYKWESMACKLKCFEKFWKWNTLFVRLNARFAKLSAYLAIPNLYLDTISSFILIEIGLLDII